eukprot:RCo004630
MSGRNGDFLSDAQSVGVKLETSGEHCTGRSNKDSAGTRSELRRERYPNSIVWTPIPVLTWIFPFVGHMGICGSDGIIHDFCGPFCISEGDMAFGNPTRFFCVNQQRQPDLDAAVTTSTAQFRATQSYNFFTNNCHSFVAHVLSHASVPTPGFRRPHWNMVVLACLVFLCGRFVSLPRALWTVLPSLMLWSLVLAFLLR